MKQRTVGGIAILAAAAASSAEPTFIDRSALCKAIESSEDEKVVECRLPSGRRSFQFRADFSGSHDDTKLSMELVLDDKAVVCGQDSKPASRFEDGEIRLTCNLAIADDRSNARTLRATIRWTHAQHEGSSLAERQP